MADYFYGTGRKRTPKKSDKPAKPNPQGRLTTGRIAKIARGQGHGFIRTRTDREVYFHRSDMQDASTFNDLEVGDTVSFELLEDAISGARALRMSRQKKR